ncbi:MAG: hypothetical protein K0R54_197 [Clostridiaceae bacterium]|jgi:hypothetical protein|nr:hypothetical protein [Clostridiaceae bacterium]
MDIKINEILKYKDEYGIISRGKGLKIAKNELDNPISYEQYKRTPIFIPLGLIGRTYFHNPIYDLTEEIIKNEIKTISDNEKEKLRKMYSFIVE